MSDDLRGHVPINLGQWHKSPPKPEDWLIQDLWTEFGAGFVHGHGGTGKTWLLADIAICMATGAKFLGHYTVKQGNTFVVVEEGSERDLYRTFERLLAGHGLTWADVDKRVAIELLRGHQLEKSTSKLKLEGAVTKFSRLYGWEGGPDLMTFDPFVGLHGLDENYATDMAQICYGAFNQIRKNMGGHMAIMVAHHDRKKSQGVGGDRRPTMRGSSVLRSWPDAIWALEKIKDDPDHCILSCDKLRGKTFDPIKFVRTVTDSWAKQELLPEATPVFRSPMANRIVQVIDAEPGISTNDLCEEVKGRKQDVLSSRQALEEEGVVLRIKGPKGVWQNHLVGSDRY